VEPGRAAIDNDTEASMTTPCQRHALNHAFLVALYAATGHPQHSELAYVRLLSTSCCTMGPAATRGSLSVSLSVGIVLLGGSVLGTS
jgi:hypothetical protein